MISATAQYALRAVVYLAGGENGLVSRDEIAESTIVPREYLSKVLVELEAAGIVESRRGRGGGYRLSRPAEEITTLEVVLCVDEIPRITECPLGFSDHVKLCPMHKLLDDTSRLVEETLSATTIADLCPDSQRSRSCGFPKKRPGGQV
ncbi:MAG: Rrf2 family transcriptional regulator [Pirellulaceae bacterium]